MPEANRSSTAWTLSPQVIVDQSQSSTCTCRLCHDKIQSGELRLGTMFTHKQGFMLLEWTHLSCSDVSVSFKKPVEYPLVQVLN